MRAMRAVLALAAAMDPAFPFWNSTSARPTMRIGLVTPLTRHGCGPSRYIAQRMAANDITSFPRRSDLCPAIASLQNDFQIAYELQDSNANAVAATRAVLKVSETGNNCATLGNKVKVVLGPNSSGSSKATSTVLSVFGIPQISWASTNADLSNKQNYPQFFRVVPPDAITMEQLVRVVLSLGFTKTTVMYFDADYQTGQMNDFMRGAQRLGLEVVGTVKIPNSGKGGASVSAQNEPRMQEALQTVKHLGCWVVAAFTIGEEALDLFRAAHAQQMVRTGWAWFSGDGLATSNHLVSDVANAEYFAGTISIAAMAQGPRGPQFFARWAAEVPLIDTPEFDTLPICGVEQSEVCTGHPEFKGWVPGTHDTDIACKAYTGLAYDAMVVLAVVFDRLLSAGKTEYTITSADWLDGLLAMQDPALGVECLTPGSIVFDENQERRTPMALYVQAVGVLQPEMVGSVDFDGTVKWCADAGLPCDPATVYWPYAQDEDPLPHTSRPAGRRPACEEGSVWDPDAAVCVPCALGTYGVPGLCLPCAAGNFGVEVAGRTSCEPCPALTAVR